MLFFFIVKTQLEAMHAHLTKQEYSLLNGTDLFPKDQTLEFRGFLLLLLLLL